MISLLESRFTRVRSGLLVGIAMAILVLLGAAGAVSANAAMPPQHVPIELTLQSGQSSPPSIFPPIWNSTYDWPVGSGYNTWAANKQTSFPQAYQLTQGLNGQTGLWLWPIGSPAAGDKYPPGYTEYVFRAPGTTRIARASVDVSFRPALYNHHCTELGLRSDDAVGTHFRDCSPPTPNNTTTDTWGPIHSRNLALFDPVASPTATEAFIRLEKPVCNGTNGPACLKYIPDNDAASGGSYLRAKKVAMTLVDDDLPVATPSGPFYDLNDTYIDGKQIYPLTVASSDAGAGIFASQFDHTLPTPPATTETLQEKQADCDPAHNNIANDSRICPATDSFSMNVNTNPFPEGTNLFRSRAIDPARNIGDTTWTIKVDRTAPTAPSTVTTDFTWDPDAGLPNPATMSWQSNPDPLLADGTLPSGWVADEVRWSLDNGPYTDWQSHTDHQVVVDPDAYPEEIISLQIRSRDAVGNLSDINTIVVVLTAPKNFDAIPMPVRIDTAKRVREEFGLAQLPDEVLVQMTDDPIYEYTMQEYGLALTPGEAFSIEQREEQELDVVDLQERAKAAYPSTFAGLWIDQEAGGRVKIAFTSNAESRTAAVMDNFPRPDMVDPLTRPHTRAELLAAYTDSTHGMDAIESAYGVTISTIAMDQETNSVRISVDQPAAVDLAAVRSQYGQAIVLQTSEPVRGQGRESYGKQRMAAGLWLGLHEEPDDVPPSKSCTTNFSAVDTSGDPDKYFLITGLHCQSGNWYQSTGLSWHVDNNEEYIGTTARVMPNKNGKADAQAIAVGRSRTSTGVWVPGYSRKVTRTQRIIGPQTDETFREVENSTVYTSGVSSGVQKGKLIDLEVTVKFEKHGIDYKFVNQRKSTQDTLPGDSGAPVYRKVRGKRAWAVGILSSSEGLIRERSLYSHIQHVEQGLGVVICIVERAECGR